MAGVFRKRQFSEIIAEITKEQEKLKDFDYVFSDGQKLKTDRKLLREALENAPEPII